MYHRVMSGLERQGEVRLITLTTAHLSDNEAFQRHFRQLRMRLLRRHLLVDYIRCPEYTENGLRHEHILFRGNFIEQSYLSYLWAGIHGAPIVDIRRTRGKRRLAGYLANYMAKAPAGRYAYSWGWVWKGFAHSWKLLKKVAYQNQWSGKDTLTIWRWMVKLKVNLREELEWLSSSITPNVVSAVSVSELIIGRRYFVS